VRARAGAAIRPALRAAVRRPPGTCATRCAASRTELEATSEFLRDHVWGGEQISRLRAQRVLPRLARGAGEAGGRRPVGGGAVGGPPPAAVRPESASARRRAGPARHRPGGCGKRRLAGQWYAARGRCRRLRQRGRAGSGRDTPAQPRGTVVATRCGRGRRPGLPGGVRPSPASTSASRSAPTTPRLGWSAHMRDELRSPGLPGPDGIDAAAPLARTGMMSPGDPGRAPSPRSPAASSASTAPSARASWRRRNPRQPLRLRRAGRGLQHTRCRAWRRCTCLNDGTVGMKTWSEGDEALLARLRDARQNGVALLEPDAAGAPAVGALVESSGGPATGRLGAGSVAHPARRRLPAGAGVETLSRLRLLLDRHAADHGAPCSGPTAAATQCTST